MTDALATSDASTPPAPGTARPLVELEDVSRRYRVGELTVTALERATLSVEPGEFTVVLGPSGSGKTTLLNMIGALDSPTEGTIRIALPETLPDLGVLPSIGLGTVAKAVGLGVVAVALAPLLTARRVRRTDVPSTLRVVE